MDIDEISDEYKNWPDRIIIPRVAENVSFGLSHQHSLFSFDRIFLKLADKGGWGGEGGGGRRGVGRGDELSDEFKNCLDKIINLRGTSP